MPTAHKKARIGSLPRVPAASLSVALAVDIRPVTGHRYRLADTSDVRLVTVCAITVSAVTVPVTRGCKVTFM
jgi:hypothetical protein